MQGPNQQGPGRRAGDPSGVPGVPDDGLKDWQRNTWFGPAPTNSNPFEEPEDAPELLQDRSENLNDRSNSFWDNQATGYQPRVSGQQETRTRGKSGQRQGGISLRAVWTLLLLIAVAAAILHFGVFRIREIRVTGNRNISAADVIRLSGIRQGQSILTLSEKETERRLTGDASAEAAKTGNYNY